MKKTVLLILVLAFTIALSSGVAKAKMVACVGNSNTYGSHLPDRVTNCFPAQLERLLRQFDPRWETRNFGVDGATVLRQGDIPYMNQGAYHLALASEPDVVVLCFGPNGSRSPNRGYIQENYVSDYISLIEAFTSLPSKPKIWICYPLKAFSGKWTISDEIIREQIIPLITQIASEKNLPIIDFYTAFEDSPHLYQSDGIHPNPSGAKLMAEIVSAVILGFRFLPDFNGDGKVDIEDLIMLIEHWNQDEPSIDLAPPPFGDGIVDVQDLEVLMSYWGQEPNDPTLVAHWALDEAEGTTAHESVNGNDDYVMGAARWRPIGGVIDGALELDGVDDCVLAAAGPNPAAGPFSLVAWIKGGAPGQVIFAKPARADWLAINAEGKFMAELESSDGLAGPLLSEAVITDGQWHRIGLVWDGSRRMLCVDGVVVAEDMQDGLEDSTGGLYVGVGRDYAPGTFFSGLIDDIRVYSRAVKP
jgi:lysophospholipase L1-like esterase